MRHEGLAIIGGGMLLVGLWMWFPPASLIVGGLLLLCVGVNEASKRDSK